MGRVRGAPSVMYTGRPQFGVDGWIGLLDKRERVGRAPRMARGDRRDTDCTRSALSPFWGAVWSSSLVISESEH